MKTRMLALLTVLGLVVAACGGSTESPSASVDAGKGDYKACLALDVGGIGDKSFNDSAQIKLPRSNMLQTSSHRTRK